MTKLATTVDGIERNIVSTDSWRSASDTLLKQEKAHMKESDKLAADRRRMPWLKIESDYVFEGQNGEVRLAALFEGRRQLIVYHHMLKPSDPAPCPGCSMVADQIPHLAHLHQRDTSLVFVSKAPLAEISAFKQRMEWTFPWYSSTDNFNADFDVNDGFGVNVFYQSEDSIYRTYFSTMRAVETMGTIWTFLDLTPLGRQENWEDSPAGSPQTEPFQWWRLHDEYT